MDKNFFKLFCIKRVTNRGEKNTVSENTKEYREKPILDEQIYENDHEASTIGIGNTVIMPANCLQATPCIVLISFSTRLHSVFLLF